MQRIGELIFDIFYLLTVIALACKILKLSRGRKQYQLFGSMALILGLGDAFHLIPRILALISNNFAKFAFYLGLGKLITSITMTAFYILLYYVWRERYHVKSAKGLDLTIWLLASLRIVLSLLPMNDWFTLEQPLAWRIYRNIPFLVIGIIIIWLFAKAVRRYQDIDLRYLWLAVVLSFAFYLPVVLWVDLMPLVGLLMIPKTCAYIWLIFMGYQAVQRNR